MQTACRWQLWCSDRLTGARSPACLSAAIAIRWLSALGLDRFQCRHAARNSTYAFLHLLPWGLTPSIPRKGATASVCTSLVPQCEAGSAAGRSAALLRIPRRLPPRRFRLAPAKRLFNHGELGVRPSRPAVRVRSGGHPGAADRRAEQHGGPRRVPRAVAGEAGQRRTGLGWLRSQPSGERGDPLAVLALSRQVIGTVGREVVPRRGPEAAVAALLGPGARHPAPKPARPCADRAHAPQSQLAGACTYGKSVT